MLDAIGEMLPSAVGVALSPGPVIAVILMLGTARARSNSLAFLGGWIGGLIVVSVVALLVGNGTESSDGTPSAFSSWLKVVLGLLLLFVAIRAWTHRPPPGTAATLPSWMSTIDQFGAGKSFGFGILSSMLNAKNLPLTIAAITTLSDAGLSGGQDVVGVVVFVLLASITVLGPVVVFFVAGQRATQWLDGIKDYVAEHNAAIMAVLFLVFGAKLLGAGLGGI